MMHCLRAVTVSVLSLSIGASALPLLVSTPSSSPLLQRRAVSYSIVPIDGSSSTSSSLSSSTTTADLRTVTETTTLSATAEPTTSVKYSVVPFVKTKTVTSTANPEPKSTSSASSTSAVPSPTSSAAGPTSALDGPGLGEAAQATATISSPANNVDPGATALSASSTASQPTPTETHYHRQSYDSYGSWNETLHHDLVLLPRPTTGSGPTATTTNTPSETALSKDPVLLGTAGSSQTGVFTHSAGPALSTASPTFVALKPSMSSKPLPSLRPPIIMTDDSIEVPPMGFPVREKPELPSPTPDYPSN